MSEKKGLSGKELAKLVEAHGWSLKRINGSHYIYSKLVAKFACRYPFTATSP